MSLIRVDEVRAVSIVMPSGSQSLRSSNNCGEDSALAVDCGVHFTSGGTSFSTVSNDRGPRTNECWSLGEDGMISGSSYVLEGTLKRSDKSSLFR
jgi:hypothetical protein